MRTFVRIGACLGLSLALAAPSLRADVVLDQKFDMPLSPAKWTCSPPTLLQSVVDGQFVMKASDPDASAYAVVMATTTAPMDQLNFGKNTVTLKFTDLALSGQSAPLNQVFLLSLADSPNIGEAVSALRFRITADGGSGSISLAFDNKPGGPQEVWEDTVSLPIKSCSLVLDADGAQIILEDARGPRTAQAKWPAGIATLWQGLPPPYLSLETHRNPDVGDVQATLGSLSAESTAAPSTAPAPSPAK